MEWWILLLIIFGCLLALMLVGFPVAFCFLLIGLVSAFLLWGGQVGLEQYIYSIFDSITVFTLLPVPLFILMGDIVFHSGIASLAIGTLDKWMGRVPGRLALLAVISGTLFATLTAVSMSAVAMLGSTLTPEMEKRGYSKEMSMGPILGCGGLAFMIPPSGLGVILGTIAQISIGEILIAIIFPGVMTAIIYLLYIVIRCKMQPNIAPVYEVQTIRMSERLIDTARYILPVSIVVFLVIGVMFLGIVGPTEASATGVLGCFILVAIYRKLSREAMKKSIIGTLTITTMMFMILIGAKGFGQILAFTGAAKALTDIVTSNAIAPIAVFIGMQVILLVLGCFMEVVSMMLVTVPIFMPIVSAFGFDPIWFAVIYLMNLEIANISPPFGMSLFVMKAVAPPNTTIVDVYKAAGPICGLNLFAMAVVIAFPAIALWLPAHMLR